MSQIHYRYPGLKPFEVSDAQLFFGRSQESRDLYNLVMVERLLVLFAKSGMGKTSLLNAGLIPLLGKTDLLPAYVRFNDTARSLHEQFFQKMEAAGIVFNPQYANKTLWEQLKYAQATKNGSPATPLIILDQFEEIFTLYTPEQRQHFVRDIAHVANRKIPETVEAELLRLVRENPEVSDETLAEMERQPPVRIIFSIRSDLLHLLNGLSAQIPDILRSRYELLPFSDKGALETIVLPAALPKSAGGSVAFSSPPFRYDDAALTEIRSELSEQGKESIESFQLQIICQAIEKLVIEKYAQSSDNQPVVTSDLYGGAAGIQHLLTNFYTDKVGELPDAQRLPARRIIEEELITESERRRSVDEGDLLKRSPLASAQLLNQLVEMRLLRKEPRLDSYYYEISHDTLVPPILVKYKERRREEERLEELERRRQEKAKLDAQLAEERRKRARARRYTLFALALATIAVAAMLYALWLRNIAEQEKRHAYANDLAFKSQIALRDGDRTAAFQLASFAQRYVETDNLQVLRALTAARYYNDHPDDPARLRLPWNSVLEGHSEPVRSVAFSLDGKKIASGSDDNTAKIWDPTTGETSMTLEGHTQHVKAVAFSPDGTQLATGSDDNTAKVWDLKTGKAITLQGHGESVISLAFSPDGTKLATGSSDNTLKIWNLTTGDTITLRGGHSEDVRAVVFSLDGTQLATASDDGTAKIWDLKTKKVRMTLKKHRGPVRSIALSSDGAKVATGSDDGTAIVWDLKTGKPLMSLEGHGAFVNSVAFSPDAKWLATGSEDKTALIWELETGQKIMKLAGHHAPIGSLAFSPDGKSLVTGSEDNTAKIWDLDDRSEATVSTDHHKGLTSIAFSPDGKKYATGSLDHTANIWDASSGQLLLHLEGHTEPILSIAFSPDGKRLATGSSDHTAKIWDLSAPTASGQGKIIYTLQGHEKFVNSVAFSPDGKWLATASGDSTAKVWDTSSGQAMKTLQGHSDQLRSLAFSPDGARLATGSADHTVKIWDWKSEKALMTLKGHSKWVRSVAFSSDGKKLASCSDDETAKIWDLKEGKVVLTLQMPDCRVLSVAFSPDGKSLATGSDDWIAKIWDLETSEVRLALEGHSGDVNSVAFSSDGKRLATASADSTAKIWELDAEVVVRQIHSKRHLAALTRADLEDWDLEGLIDIQPGNEAHICRTEAPDQVVAFADLYAKNVRNPSLLARAVRLYESAATHGSPATRKFIAQRYSDLGKDQLYLPNGKAAEETLRRGLALDPANPHLPLYLAPALLLQGRYQDAEKIYFEYRDKPYEEGAYRDAFLRQLDDLDDQGIVHPDIARIRLRLKEGQ